MSQPQGGSAVLPCGWSPDLEVVPTWDATEEAIQDAALTLAGQVLWNATGRQYSACPVRVRPCERIPLRPTATPDWYLGRWTGWSGVGSMPPVLAYSGCQCSTESCLCGRRSTILLQRPVVSVEQVLIDGVTLDPTHYRLDRPNLLVRTDGGSWPWGQDLTLADTALGAFTVDYTVGTPVPPGGDRVLAMLAGELAKAMQHQDCDLPDRVQHISREGIDLQFLDPQQFLDEGKTGITLVDLWIRSVNPYQRFGQSSVYSPDLRRARSRGRPPS